MKAESPGSEKMETDKNFTGPVSQFYDSRLGPILFEPFAGALAERLGDTSLAILETAAGRGWSPEPWRRRDHAAASLPLISTRQCSMWRRAGRRRAS